MSRPGQSGIRTRVLSSAELRTIWQAADMLGYPFGHMYQLLVCTGLRLTNVALLVMDEYHDAHEALIVSPERMKRKPNDVRSSEQSRVGNEGVSTGRSRWATCRSKTRKK